MAMPLHQSVRLGSYLFKQKVLGRKKFPILVELEPLFACNLACAGCGKIAHPASVLRPRMPTSYRPRPPTSLAPGIRDGKEYG